MKKILVEHFGPIKKADVTLGDMTILIGAQASGKSLFLQLFKLLEDQKFVIQTMKRYNYVVAKNPCNVLNFYFGDGMSKMWGLDTHISTNIESNFRQVSLINSVPQEVKESVFYIPAQRILSIADGRPKNFMEFDAYTPFVLRQFSEQLRLFFQYGLNGNNLVFPLKNRLKGAVKRSLQENIFHYSRVIIDETTGQKRMRLLVNDMNIPFMAWSAGQKEFMPLLMAFYCLSGPVQNVIDRSQYKYVILEEPEMGLHPKAILSILLQTLELMQHGYKIILSTHSSVVLEFVWAFNAIKNSQIHCAPKEQLLEKLFNVEQFDGIHSLFSDIFSKDIKTYYFNNQNNRGVHTMDISSLDVDNNDSNISDWGGISQFASHASEIVSKIVTDYDR